MLVWVSFIVAQPHQQHLTHLCEQPFSGITMEVTKSCQMNEKPFFTIHIKSFLLVRFQHNRKMEKKRRRTCSCTFFTSILLWHHCTKNLKHKNKLVIPEILGLPKIFYRKLYNEHCHRTLEELHLWNLLAIQEICRLPVLNMVSHTF